MPAFTSCRWREIAQARIAMDRHPTDGETLRREFNFILHQSQAPGPAEVRLTLLGSYRASGFWPKSALVGGPLTQLISQAASTVMNTSESFEAHAWWRIFAGM